MFTILLVEDDQAIREGIAFSFENTEYNLLTAKNIKEAKATADSGSLGLVLLDVSLPDGNGFDFYKSYLKENAIPVIFLTARDDEDDIVKGLELGAEDYITKPFSMKELMARVKKVSARYRETALIQVGDISFNFEKMEVKKAGQIVKLSSLELKILELLINNRNMVVSRDSVIDCIWEATGNDVYDHTVTVYIKRIRQKLDTDIIKTVKGLGYRIDL